MLLDVEVIAEANLVATWHPGLGAAKSGLGRPGCRYAPSGLRSASMPAQERARARKCYIDHPTGIPPVAPTGSMCVKIAVMGSGGVGGYFGARLATSGADVT